MSRRRRVRVCLPLIMAASFLVNGLAAAESGASGRRQVVSTVEEALESVAGTVVFTSGVYRGDLMQPDNTRWIGRPGTVVRGQLVSGKHSLLRGFDVSGGRVGVVCRAHSVCRNLNVHHNSQEGIHVGSNRVRLIRNRVHDNNLDLKPVVRGNPCWNSGGIHMVLGNHVVLRGNRIIHNGCDGVHIDIGMRYGTFKHNVVKRNTRFGVFVETSCDQMVKRNRFKRNRAGVYIGNSPRVKVVKNSFRRNGLGIVWHDRTKRDYAPGSVQCKPRSKRGGRLWGNRLHGDRIVGAP
jgi:nitrous oxidase accessory protein NosD